MTAPAPCPACHEKDRRIAQLERDLGRSRNRCGHHDEGVDGSEGAEAQMKAWYNEIDPFKAEVLREAIKAGAIAPGDVDERSIADVQPGELVGYTQCHFFAGGGFWSLALRLAGWPDDRPVWTGSCPCQPFSAAGKQAGFADERHLFPEWLRLIRGCRPVIILGEQVSASIRGINRKDANLPELRGRETILRVLRELQGQPPRDLYGVHEDTGEIAEAVGARTGDEAVFGLAQREARLRAGERGPLPGEGQRSSLHAGPRGYSSEDRRWSLRSDGNTVRPHQASLMECAVPGQDQSIGRVYPDKCARDLVFTECDGEHLGYPEGRGSGELNPRAAYKAKRRFERTVDRAFEGAAGGSWLDLISDGLEGEGYTLRAAVCGAHSAGAPHIRQRLYFGAVSNSGRAGEITRDHRKAGEEAVGGARTDDGPAIHLRGRATGQRAHADGRLAGDGDVQRGGQHGLFAPDRGTGKLADAELNGGRADFAQRGAQGRTADGRDRATGDGGDTGSEGLQERLRDRRVSPGTMGSPQGEAPLSAGEPERGPDAGGEGYSELARRRNQPARLAEGFGPLREWRGPGWLDPLTARSVAAAGATRGFWADCDWWYGRDGKYRPIKSGIFPLAHGSPARVGRLRMYGDAINVETAKEFIAAFRETRR